MWLALLTLFAPAEARTFSTFVQDEAFSHETFWVWDGGSTNWGYNHRVNRLGSWIEDEGCRMVRDQGTQCSARLMSSAASGTGEDSAQWQTRANFVSADGIQVHEGVESVSVSLVGEGNDWSRRIRVDVPIAKKSVSRFANDTAPVDFAALLQGWDIGADDGADQLQHLQVLLTEPTYNGSTATFYIDIEGNFTCATPECDPFNDDVAYTFYISWQLIAGADASFAATAQSPLVEDYDFFDAPYQAASANQWEELVVMEVMEERNEHLKGPILVGEAGWSKAVQGIRGFSADLTIFADNGAGDPWGIRGEYAHYEEFAVMLGRGAYKSGSGAMQVQQDLFLQQWGYGSWVKNLAATEPGNARMVAYPVLLQFDSGCSREVTSSGTIAWPGGNASGWSGTAEGWRRHEFQQGTCN